jgi:hypothetical protein
MAIYVRRLSAPLQRPPINPYATRALALWPRLDAAGLRRAKGDPDRIARLVERRTGRPGDEILAMLKVPLRTSS